MTTNKHHSSVRRAPLEESIIHGEKRWVPNSSATIAAHRLADAASRTGPYVAYGLIDGKFICEADSEEELNDILGKSEYGPDFDGNVVIIILNNRDNR